MPRRHIASVSNIERKKKPDDDIGQILATFHPKQGSGYLVLYHSYQANSSSHVLHRQILLIKKLVHVSKPSDTPIALYVHETCSTDHAAVLSKI